jgi:hypothetical protein
MTTLLGAFLALWLSFVVVWVPSGMKPNMPEFWVTPWLYGWPLVLLAWPLYLTLFKRVPNAAWWKLAVLGLVLSLVPFWLLAIAGNLIRGASPLGVFR